MLRKFNPTSRQRERAVQAWQVLIGAAMGRRTITYAGLAQAMYRRPAQGVLDRILGHVAYYCIDNKLPPLTSIVVGSRRGTPGANIPVNLAELDRLREKVYLYDWYDVYPPSAEELSESFERHMT